MGGVSKRHTCGQNGPRSGEGEFGVCVCVCERGGGGGRCLSSHVPCIHPHTLL